MNKKEKTYNKTLQYLIILLHGINATVKYQRYQKKINIFIIMRVIIALTFLGLASNGKNFKYFTPNDLEHG